MNQEYQDLQARLLNIFISFQNNYAISEGRVIDISLKGKMIKDSPTTCMPSKDDYAKYAISHTWPLFRTNDH